MQKLNKMLKKFVHLIIVTLLIFLISCAAKLSENGAKTQIKAALEAKYSETAGSSLTVDINVIGIRMDGKTAVVKAEVVPTGSWAIVAKTEIHNFNFRKYDKGWIIESYN